MGRTRPHLRAPRTGRPRPAEREVVTLDDGVIRLLRNGRRVGEVVPLPESDDCVLAGDTSSRRYPSVDAALAELDAQYDRAMVGQP